MYAGLAGDQRFAYDIVQPYYYLVTESNCNSLTGVQEQVIFQIRVLAEPSVADVTLERPRSVVHVHVRFQIAGRRERLGAQSALMRFLLQTQNIVRIYRRKCYWQMVRVNGYR